ncbi:putative leader peptide [Pilimelia anulata]
MRPTRAPGGCPMSELVLVSRRHVDLGRVASSLCP